jgi:hypothetical protein
MACVYDYTEVLSALQAKLFAVESMRGIARARINATVFPTEEERDERPSTWAYLDYVRSKNCADSGNLRVALLAYIASIREAVTTNEQNLRNVVDEVWGDVCVGSEYCCEPEMDEKVVLIEKEYGRAIDELEHRRMETTKPCVAEAIGRAKDEIGDRLARIRVVGGMVAATARTRTALECETLIAKRSHKKPKAYFTSKRHRDMKLKWLAARAVK